MKTSEGSGSAPAPQPNLGNQGCARLQEVDAECFPKLPSRIPALLSPCLPLSFSQLNAVYRVPEAGLELHLPLLENMSQALVCAGLLFFIPKS